VLVVTQVIGDLALQGRLQHQLRQLRQQPALALDAHALPLSLADQLRHQRPVHHRRPRGPLLDRRHVLPSLHVLHLRLTHQKNSSEGYSRNGSRLGCLM
jgi:hypothetical protein